MIKPHAQQRNRPISDILRPQNFSQIIGQKHLLGEKGILTNIIKSGKIPSLILYGPAGSGKTTIAKNLAKINNSHEEILLATNSNTSDLRKIFEESKKRKANGIDTILIVDEIHHFNRSQQDLFLPFIEDGTIILIGATTENPSFELNSALLSRCRVMVLEALKEEDLEQIVERAEEYFGQKFPLSNEARKELINLCSGDARYLINLCEELNNYSTDQEIIEAPKLLQILQQKSANYDKDRDGHYGLISAFHKALRGSDADAALYYLARMMLAGENPHYVLRRLTRFASEDIGNADPNALLQCLAAKESYDFLGSPEGDYAISNAVIYCATAPKSNACYLAHKKAFNDAKKYNNLLPPKHILNAPTSFMKGQGIGDGYIYDHDTKNCFSGQEYFPEELLAKNHGRPKYYQPNSRGFERELIKRLEYWENLRSKNN